MELSITSSSTTHYVIVTLSGILTKTSSLCEDWSSKGSSLLTCYSGAANTGYYYFSSLSMTTSVTTAVCAVTRELGLKIDLVLRFTNGDLPLLILTAWFYFLAIVYCDETALEFLFSVEIAEFSLLATALNVFFSGNFLLICFFYSKTV